MKALVYGNGESRPKELPSGNYISWGCNAIYRDTKECDIVFAVDMPVQKEIVESEYYRTNMVAFADIDPLPIEMIDMFLPTFNNVDVSVKEDDTHFIIQGDDESTQFLGLIRPETILTYNDPLLKNLFTGMSALGFAMQNGYDKINLIGFDALESDSFENIYAGSSNYMHKYNTDSNVLNAQRSQFIALLKYYENCSVYWKNPLDIEDKILYNGLYYYENSERWILGQGLESEI